MYIHQRQSQTPKVYELIQVYNQTDLNIVTNSRVSLVSTYVVCERLSVMQ